MDAPLNESAAQMQVIPPNTDPFQDPQPEPGPLPMPRNFKRIAVVCEAGLFSRVALPQLPADAFALVTARLAEDDLVRFDYFPAIFSGISAPAAVNGAFDRITLQHGRQPYDLIAIVGGAGVTADISCIHQVLAPRMASAGVPVFTALGNDDAETILGDTASRAFASPEALIDFIAERVDARHPPVSQLIARMQSVATFLLAEQEVATKIQLQAGLMPALRNQFDVQMRKTAQAGQEVRRVASLLTTRLARDEAALQHLHSRIATQIARLAQTTHITRPVAAVAPTAPPAVQRVKRHTRIDIGLIRLGIGVAYITLIALLWWLTTPANIVFFGGCGLVLMSAIYVAITNHLLDKRDLADQLEGDSRHLPNQTKENHID